MKRFYVLIERWAVYVKEAEFFESQGGLTKDWGKDWVCMYATDLENARVKGKAIRDHLLLERRD